MKYLLGSATVAATALLAMAGTSSAEGWGFDIHFAPADYSACDGLDDQAITCDDIDPVGAEFTEQFAWIVAWGWENAPEWPEGEGIGGVLYSVRYPKDTTITGWSLCTGGSQILVDNPVDGTWPQSETGMAATWAGGGFDSATGFAKVGFLVVADGSFGTLEIVPHVTTETVQMSSPGTDPTTIDVTDLGWGRGDIDGTEGDTYVVCAKVPTATTSWSAIKSMY